MAWKIGEKLKNARLKESIIVDAIKDAIQPGDTSLPCSPPNKQTGELKSSIRSTPEGQGFLVYGTDYATFLEYGTLDMAPRPFIRPVLEEKKQELTLDIKRQLQG